MAKQTKTSEDNATANGELMSPAEVAAMQESGDLAGVFVQEVDRSWFEGVTIERVVPMEDKMGVRGVFLGAGPPVEITDQATGEIRPLGTWRLQVAPLVVIRVLDSARLKSEFTGKKDDGSLRCRVMRMGSGKARSGKNFTDYVVGWEAPSFRFKWESQGDAKAAQS